jgi:hypothetical protein
MEGTSGAADCVPFREGIREAALSGGGLAKAGLSPGGYVRALIEGLRRRRHLHVCVEACSRHEVSEPIGLGKNLLITSDRGGRRRHRITSLPRP